MNRILGKSQRVWGQSAVVPLPRTGSTGSMAGKSSVLHEFIIVDPTDSGGSVALALTQHRH